MSDFSLVTETWGLPASREQLAMPYLRYRTGRDVAAGGRVLEIGCGAGMGLGYLRGASPLVVGSDYTQTLLQQARRELPEMPLVRLDAHRLPFVAGSFDTVLLLEMIYYLDDPAAALAECRRVLAADGRILVSLPNRLRPDFNPSPLASAYPDADELASLLEAAGFKPRVYGAFPLQPAGGSVRLLTLLRHIAVRLHLIPRSMRAKALVKRVLFGRLPRLSGVADGVVELEALAELDTRAPAHLYTNLYGLGALTPSPRRRSRSRTESAAVGAG